MRLFTCFLVLVGGGVFFTPQDWWAGRPSCLSAAEVDKAPATHAVTANNGFALDLYGQLAQENQGKNLFFSPYSILSALAMAAEGARGETAAEMGKVLCFPETTRNLGDNARLVPWNMALIHSGLAELNGRFITKKPAAQGIREKIEKLRRELNAVNQQINKLKGGNAWEKLPEASEKAEKLAAELNSLLSQVDQYELRMANALWVEKMLPIEESYLKTIGKFYGTGGARSLDFRNQPEAARLQINAWVEEQTKNRIKDLLPPGSVDNLTRLILTNAIYFKGEWVEMFSKGETKVDDFLLADGGKASVPMMHRRNLSSARYAAFNGDGTFFDTPREVRRGTTPQLYPDERGFTILEMPYKGEALAMVVIVPQAADGLPRVEKLLTPANLQNWFDKLQKRAVHVFLPKFKVEEGYRMNDTLKALGMVRAFTAPTLPNGAEFDGVFAGKDPYEKLYIAFVMHKAFVEVDEKGTEAAAATAVGMAETGALPTTVPFTPTFRADKPFVFLIRDNHTGCILFLGRMENPKK